MNLKSYALPICQHEAGHYIASNALGFKTGGIKIKIGSSLKWHEASSLVFLNKPVTNFSGVKKYLTHRIAILCAGVIAQSVENGEINISKSHEIWEDSASKNDRDKIDECMALLSNVAYPTDATKKELNKRMQSLLKESWTLASRIVLENIDVLTGISNTIFMKIERCDINYEVNAEDLKIWRDKVKKFKS
ncbi:hypothetical protein [Pantoea ananatis]|uniref:hypothetical protein n=1 Tax=Pantoea ananas TaxID=553 RepID=UPI0003B1AF63|nr:hypothetical protein [Pantoea ananatis]ERM12985.1 hypothetical protein L585_16960 [Pantoea ananatis BRT175]KNA28338.1 hypothetical protein ACO03_04995 [Pantoea ananatis]MDJ0032328.1 hypothetical protein [Pantoea ananatis]MDJ0045510.1 hypothetical protein [Pantoea ananatis]SFX16120.1 hypothetical protein SAMN03097714_0923 [Pantoea ananatis]